MEYLFIVLLLLGSAFFSGTEIAYTSLSKLKIKKDRENPKGIRKLVLFIYDHFDNALSTLLIGNNLVNIGATSLATVLAVKLADSMGGKIADDTASTIVTVVMTALILIVGEITPKMIARRCSDLISKMAAVPLLALMILRVYRAVKAEGVKPWTIVRVALLFVGAAAVLIVEFGLDGKMGITLNNVYLYAIQLLSVVLMGAVVLIDGRKAAIEGGNQA